MSLKTSILFYSTVPQQETLRNNSINFNAYLSHKLNNRIKDSTFIEINREVFWKEIWWKYYVSLLRFFLNYLALLSTCINKLISDMSM